MTLGRWMTILLGMLSMSFVDGQTFYKVIGTSGNDYANHVFNDRDSGFVIVGSTEGIGQGNMDGYVLKLDTAGEILWTRTFGDIGVDRLVDGVLLSDGFLFCGYSNVNSDYQTYLIRTDEIGQTIWEKRIGNENWEFPKEMSLINDTSALIVGEVIEDGSSDKNALALAMSIDGDSLWYKSYGGDYYDTFDRVLISEQKQFYWCGTKGLSEEDEDYWVLRVDSVGTIIWELTMGDTLIDQAHGITELITGEFIITGEYNSTQSSGIDNVFYKIDSAGNILYQNVLNNSGDDRGFDVISYPDTNAFYLISRSSSVGLGGFDTWVFDCNYYTFGNYSFGFDFGTNRDDLVMDADTTFDKGVVMVGNIFDPSLGNSIFVNKTGETTHELSYQVEEDLYVKEVLKNKLQLYPNPAKDIIYFLNHEVIGESYKVFNVTGDLIQEGLLSTSYLELGLPSGLYIIQVGPQTEKLILQNN